jgi:hypothetical protein
MKPFRSYFVAALGLMILAGSLVLAGAGSGTAKAALPPTQEVTLVNTAANPVPTQAQGTTNVTGTVQAQQAGAWNVGINGTVPVYDTIQGAKEPVMINLGDNLTAAPGGQLAESQDYVVPAGKRLVIEQSYLIAQVLPGGRAVASLTVTTGQAGPAGLRRYPLLLTKQVTQPLYDAYVASGPTKIYVAGPASLRIEVSFDDPSPNNGAAYPSLAGYLEPAQ